MTLRIVAWAPEDDTERWAWPAPARRQTRREAEAWLLARMRDHRVSMAALDRMAAWAGAPASGSLRDIARAVAARGPR